MVVRELVNIIGFKVKPGDEQKADGVLKKITGSLFNMQTLALGATAAAVAGIVAMGRTALKTAIDMEAMNAQFEVLTGSAENAKNLTKDLIDFAVKTPFRLEDLSKGTQTLLNFGVTQKEILPVMQQLGDIAGGNSEKLQTLALVFGQIKGLGKLQGQDWRQLINVGFNPLESIAKKTGKTMGELQEEMSKGTISFEMFADAVSDAVGEGGRFHNNMLKASQTVKGLISTMQDAFTLSLGNAANQILPDIKKFIKIVIPLIEGPFQRIVTFIFGVIKPILGLLLTIIEPIFWVIDKITEVLEPVLDGVSGTLQLVGKSLQALFKLGILPLIVKLKLIFTILGPIFKLLGFVLKPLFFIFNEILRVINDLIDRFSIFFDQVINNGVETIKEKFSGIAKFFQDLFSNITGFFTNVINSIIDGLNWVIEKTNAIAKTKIELIEKISTENAKLTKDITNNNQKITNINMQNSIDARGSGTSKQSLERAAGSIFNMELKKLLMENGGLS